MGTGTGPKQPAPPAPEQVPFKRLPRSNKHRTSQPTDDAIRAAVWVVTRERGGNDPLVEAVILACVRMATQTDRQLERLIAEVTRIEAEVFMVKPRPGSHDPGEPSQRAGPGE